MAVMASLAGLASTSAALAKQPTGDFATFKQCPRFTPGLTNCLYSQVTSGEYVLGNATVPIVNTVTLQGGISVNEETGAETFVNALGGATLSRTPQPVPGGLLGMVSSPRLPRSFRREIDRAARWGGLDVRATVELAQQEGGIGISEINLLAQGGPALTLPVKIKLDNPFLGNRCYVGSRFDPIVLNLTDGETAPPAPNQPIKGKFGEFEFKDEGAVGLITNNTLVENAFAVPQANGCGGPFSFVIDRILNQKLGLPSAAGHNSVVQNGSVEIAAAAAVVASEQ
jgi:hypothetical protein